MLNTSHITFLKPGNYADEAPKQGLEEERVKFSVGLPFMATRCAPYEIPNGL